MKYIWISILSVLLSVVSGIHWMSWHVFPVDSEGLLYKYSCYKHLCADFWVDVSFQLICADTEEPDYQVIR